MSVKKCPKCGSVWYTALSSCAFCGVEGVEQQMPTHTGRLPGERGTAAQREPAAEDSAVAVAEATPVPPTHSDAAPSCAPEPKPAAEPVQEAQAEVQPPPRTEPPAVSSSEPEPARKPEPPPAPQVPSANVPLVSGALGVAAFLWLPVAIYFQAHPVLGILGFLAEAILVPFAPFAWFAGQRYEDRCRALNFQPARQARTGRVLGMVATFVLVFEGALIAALVAVLKIVARAPAPPPG